MKILAVADDLTGALETGAKFAARGFSTVVTLWPCVAEDDRAEVLVIDAETRHLPALGAAARVGKIADGALSSHVDLFFHKTDSTLRGNIGAEMNALAKVFAESGVEYAPAYPALGRTVIGGRLFVNSVPAHQTEFAYDPRNPVWTNDVRGIVGDHPAIRVHDGKTEQDVAAIARAILAALPRPAACGPAALAGHLAAQLRPDHPVATNWPRVTRCVVVNGSAHPRSLEQIHAAPRDWPILTSVASTVEADALIIFGGDTSFEILRGLGVTALRPMGEILPGVPFSRIEGGFAPRYIITKAGGFGSIDLLEQLRRLLA